MTRRKYSLLILAICFTLFASMLCGCNILPSAGSGNENSNSSNDYKLTVQDPNGYVIEDLQDQYKAGDEVTVKTEMLDDVNLIAYLDGVSLGFETHVSEKDEYHCEFYFEMPSHDAVLSFRVYNGMAEEGIVLSKDIQREIVSAFVNAHSKDSYPVAENEISLRCFGSFDGAYVLFIDVASWGYSDAIEVDVISGVKFVYGDGRMMEVYYDGAFYSISEAYEANVLSYDNLLATQETYKAYHEILYTENYD